MSRRSTSRDADRAQAGAVARPVRRRRAQRRRVPAAAAAAIDDADERETRRRIVADHLDRLAQHDVNGLARLLKRTPAAIEAACERIRHLSPRPGWKVEPTATQFITPDVIVRKIRGRWTATLNRAVVPRVKLNQTYASMFQEHREAQHGELAQHLQEARWTVKNVQQRFSTILMVAEAILKRQQHFLEFGPMAMKPLGLREIADRARPARVDRLAGHQQQVHGDPGRRVRAQVLLLARDGDGQRRSLLGDGDPRRHQGHDRCREPGRPAVRRADRAPARSPGPEGRAAHGDQVPAAAEAGIGRAPAPRRPAA